MERLTRPWLTRTLRLTAFTPTPFQDIPADAWTRATGGKELSIDHSEPPQRARMQAGLIGPGMLVLQIQGLAQRIDWFMAPPATEGGLPSTEFGPVEQALETFSEVIRPWLQGVNVEITRLALGIIAAIPSSDRIAAYAALQGLLPSVKIDGERTRELLYRVNRPKPSRSLGSEVELNRITTWGAVRLSTINPQTGVIMDPSIASFISLECDNSTPAERQEPLGSAQLVDIYDELLEMALQNLELGEIP